MKFEMTKCNQCGSEMLMGANICPSCGGKQNGNRQRLSFHQPRTILAVALAVAVLFIFQWLNPRTPNAGQVTSPSAVAAPVR